VPVKPDGKNRFKPDGENRFKLDLTKSIHKPNPTPNNEKDSLLATKRE